MSQLLYRDEKSVVSPSAPIEELKEEDRSLQIEEEREGSIFGRAGLELLSRPADTQEIIEGRAISPEPRVSTSVDIKTKYKEKLAGAIHRLRCLR